jgi:hypothetical protein
VNKVTNPVEIMSHVVIGRLTKIIVDVWDDHECWKCREKSPVIDWKHESGEGELWSQDDHIGRKLQDMFPFFKKGYTKMTGTLYYANHCPRCGTIQGDWFVMEWVIQQNVVGKKPLRTVEIAIP